VGSQRSGAVREALWIELGVLGSGGVNFGLLLRSACSVGILDCSVPHGSVIVSSGLRLASGSSWACFCLKLK